MPAKIDKERGLEVVAEPFLGEKRHFFIMYDELLLIFWQMSLSLNRDEANVVKNEKWDRVQSERNEDLNFVKHECVTECKRRDAKSAISEVKAYEVEVLILGVEHHKDPNDGIGIVAKVEEVVVST